ncbi:hypothetical protein [Kutzneria sp. NPDC052558]|uniref:hypothetical protein n=1 Tax=Kutzneria sp. NPDC052558 TaxID=3364121 RepID=UPI0037C97972
MMHGALEDYDVHDDRRMALRRIVDDAPVPVRDPWIWAQAQSDLQSAIAERMNRDVGELPVTMTARVTFVVHPIAWETWTASDRRASPSTTADDVLRTLGALELMLPVASRS